MAAPGRPDVAKASGPRPTSYDLKIRDNEIRHYVDLLVLAGMPERIACNAIADAFEFTRKRVNDIMSRPIGQWKNSSKTGTALSPPPKVSS